MFADLTYGHFYFVERNLKLFLFVIKYVISSIVLQTLYYFCRRQINYERDPE